MPVETTKIKICNLNNVLNFTCKGMHETGILPARNYYRMQELNFLDETLDQVDASQETAINQQISSRILSTVFVSHRAESVSGARVINIVLT